jgi:hypothetical protein
MGFWSALGKIGKGALSIGTGGLSDVIGGIGAGLSGASQASATNRGEQFGGQLDLMRLLMDRDKQYQDMAIARDQEGRTSASDAYKKLLSTAHLLNPGPRPQLAGMYSVAPRQASDAEVQGAGALQNEVMQRLLGGNPLPQVDPRQITTNDAGVRVDPGLLKSGLLEKIAGIAGPGLMFGAALGQSRKQKTSA